MTTPNVRVSEEDVGNNPSIFLELDGYGTLAQMGGGELSVRRSHAARLARCWNAHDALLAACEKLLDIIQAQGGTFAMLHQAECAEATAAVAKAAPPPDGRAAP
jgi:hypothetical protein